MYMVLNFCGSYWKTRPADLLWFVWIKKENKKKENRKKRK